MNKEALSADQVDEGLVADAIEAQVKLKDEIPKTSFHSCTPKMYE